MGRPPVQLSRSQELALIEWWNARRPVAEIAKELAISTWTLSRLVVALRKAGHRLIQRHGRLAHTGQRKIAQSARKAGRIMAGAAAAHRPAPMARSLRIPAGFVIEAGVTRSAGNVSRSPAVLVSKAIRRALSDPPIPDVIIYDGAGKPIRRLDGLTRREKPL